jgi:hypothetical protein
MTIPNTTKWLATIQLIGYNLNLTMGNGFDADFAQVNARVEALECLDYDAFYNEVIQDRVAVAALLDEMAVNARSVDAWRYQWRQILKDAEALKDGLPILLEQFKNGARDAEAKGVWSNEQAKKYIWRCNDLANAFADKLEQFGGIFQRAMVMLRPEALPKEYATQRVMNAFGAAYDKELLLPYGKGYKWLSTNVLLAYFLGNLFCNDDFSNVWKVVGTFPNAVEGVFVDRNGKVIEVGKARQKRVIGGQQPLPQGWELINDILR